MKRLGLIVSLIWAMTACAGQTSPPRSGSDQSPAVTSQSPAASHTSPPVSVSNLKCRLPVDAVTTGTDEAPGGWFTFPGGQFTRDPASLPRLQDHVPSYDWPFKRWVPVEPQYVSPDGAKYLLPQPNSFYIVDVATGSRRPILSTSGPPQAPGSWQVVQYAQEGIYLTSAGMLTVPGLWLLDPVTGNVRMIRGSEVDAYWNLVGGGGAWTLAGSPNTSQTVVRLDLDTGQATTWYRFSGIGRLLAVDDRGEPLLALFDDRAHIGLLAGAGEFRSLELQQSLAYIGDAYAAHPGVWLPLKGGGVALYTPKDGVQVLSSGPGPDIFDVAGGCF